MGDLFFSFLEFNSHLVKEASHGFFSVQHTSGFLITLDIVLNLLLQVLVNSFIFQNAQKALIDLTVQDLVLVGQVEVLLSKVFTLDG